MWGGAVGVTGVGTELVVTSSNMSGNFAEVSARIVHHSIQGVVVSDLACATLLLLWIFGVSYQDWGGAVLVDDFAKAEVQNSTFDLNTVRRHHSHSLLR